MAKGKNFSWVDYFSARLVRLWLVLIPALVFTAVCDFLTLRAVPNAFDGALSSLWNSGPSSLEGFGWQVFAANGLFLQTIVAPVFGSNGPLWSLANEFWYYVLFPLIACSICFMRDSGFFKRGIILLLAMYIALWLPGEIVFYFAIWLMGVACFLVMQKYSPKINRPLTFLSIILFAFSLVATKISPNNDQLMIWMDILVGLCFSILLICLNGHEIPWSSRRMLNSVIKSLSDFSYSLYLFHFPLVILLAVTLVGDVQLQPNLASVVALLGATGLCLFVAWMSWFLFERHNDYIRRHVRRLIAYLPILRSRVIGNWGTD